MTSQVRLRCAGALVAVIWLLWPPAVAAGIPNIPKKTYPVAGGAIEVQAGVVENVNVAPMGFGKLRHPVQYFLIVTNHTKGSIWLTASLTFPGKKPKVGELTEIAPEGAKLFPYGRFGVITDEEIPWDVAVYADSTRATRLAELHLPMLFEKREAKIFLDSFPAPAQSLMNGLRDTDPVEPAAGAATAPSVDTGAAGPPEPAAAAAPSSAPAQASAGAPPANATKPAGATHPAESAAQSSVPEQEARQPAPVPGTWAGPELQRDVIQALVRQEHLIDAACEVHVLRAEPLGEDELSFIGRAAKKGARSERRLRRKGLLIPERWYLESCGQEKVYEVVMMPSASGGTDILARPFDR